MPSALWIAQGLLAVIFALVGTVKLVLPKEQFAQRQPWAIDFSPTTIKLIGALEVLGALGLIAPLIPGIPPWVAALAAIGLGLTMIGAMVTHARRREYPSMVANLVLLVLAAFVAYGRLALGSL